MNYITFDIETYSPSESNKIDTNELRVSVVGAYFSWLDKYVAFLEDDVKDFLNLLRECDLVIGYNHMWFDLPVLQKYADWDLKKISNYDLMLEIEKKSGFKAKLDDIAKANLGTKKTDTYEKYRHYYKEGKWLELIDYCMNDVKITEAVFRMVLNKQKIKYQDVLELKEFALDDPKFTKVEIGYQPDSIF